MITVKNMYSLENTTFGGSYGFAMLSIILSISIMSVSMLSFLSKINIGTKEVKHLSKKIQRQNIELAVGKLMDSEKCTCHFDPTQNTNISSTSLGINTSTSEDIPLGALRTGCDFSLTNNILIQDGSSLGKGLVVDKVKVSNIRSEEGSSENFLGDLTITYANEGRPEAFRPSVIPITFSVDSSSGSSENRPVKNCESLSNRMTTPPSFPCHLADTEAGAMDDTELGSMAEGRTLLGCGGAVDENRSGSTTSFGFRAGKSSASHMGSTYFGYEAGMTHNNIYSTMVGYRAGKMSIHLRRSNLIGYRAGENTKWGQNFHFIGAEAGLNTFTRVNNIFIGASAGRNNRRGMYNIFLGYEAGRDGPAADDNIFIGYRAGLSNVGYRNTFIGSQAGEANTSGGDSVVIGYRAGYENPFISKSVLLGSFAGRESDGGQHSVFVGYLSGRKNRGDYNTFVGNYTGTKNVEGYENVFVGHRAGDSNIIGSKNTFIGELGGSKNESGSYNTFIGRWAGYNNITGSSNTMIGFQAGYLNEGGSHNIFIGTDVGDISYANTDSKFVMGNTYTRTWVEGDMTSTGNLYVNDQQVVVTSSRFLKKNIRPVTQFRKYLDDLLKTSLFTYQYKSSRNQPNKTRMGVISEELPQNLKIQMTEGLPHPDWPTVYGSFWASLKALHGIKKELEEQFLLKYQDFLFKVRSIKKKQLQVNEVWIQHKKEMSSIKSQFRQIHREMEQIQKDILKTKNKFDEDWQDLIARLSRTPLDGCCASE